VATNVISQLASAFAKLNAITKICKYKGVNEGHPFILMAMEVHNTPKCDMDRFIRELFVIFTINNQNLIYLYLFAFNFSSNVLILLFNVLLASTINRKIALAGNVCSRPPITIKSHHLHAGDIKRVVGEITSYHRKD
jgi:hypothetical protein